MGGKKVFELMLEVGHKSQPLKTKLPNGYTHKWTVFVRGANNNKIEHCIQRVVFQLHDSFPVPSREITSPPYQVKETGYAGFEIPIEIYFKSRDKTNHVVFTLDLMLLTDKPNNSNRLEKLKFFNPHKEFEKCLIKAGAQLISITKDKKERSHSPPAKRQKSSSLIPSKDMCKPAIRQNQSLSQGTNNRSQSPAPQNTYHPPNSQTQHHHNQSKASSQPSQNHSNHTNNSGGSSGNSLFSNHTSHQINHHSSVHDNNRHQSSTKPSSHQQLPSVPKTKTSSREFIDVFGAPIVYNNSKSHKSNGCKESSDNHKDVTFTANERSPLPPIKREKSPQLPASQSHNNQSHHHKSSHHHRDRHHHHHHHQSSKHNHTKHHAEPQPPPPQQAPLKVAQKPPPPLPPPQQQQPPQQSQPLSQSQPQPFVAQTDPFTTIQNKIASLTDCDRLQKIVDIIEESGEWFNLTPNKFEFDLKRLDKKTLSRIEKCLQF